MSLGCFVSPVSVNVEAGAPDGLAEVQINGGNRPQLTLLLADDTTAGTFWRQDTPAGAVLERGLELVRKRG